MHNKTDNFNINRKMIVLGVLTLIMLIPLGMVSGLIKERENNKFTAIRTISSAWGKVQTLSGPVLSVPVRVVKKDTTGKQYSDTEYVNFLPEKLDINGNVTPEIRYKGIFKHPVYTADLKIQGNFANIIVDTVNSNKVSPGDVLWDKAFITFGISDLKGISAKPLLNLNNKEIDFAPGIYKKALVDRGIHAFLNLNKDNLKNIPFVINLNLKGNDYLAFKPVAKQNNVSLSSSWKDPNFIGDFLPVTKTVSENGFKANWYVSHFASDFGAVSDDSSGQSFGVSLLMPVDSYRNSIRAVKYGILFIVLTFIACLIFEIISKIKIHPFQYILVGLAISVFYLLMVSFSEFMDFSVAYLIASISTVALIASYTHISLARKSKPVFTAVMSVTLLLLYSYLYILLQLQDMSLLFGSIGIFTALAAIMYATRNIDWYNDLSDSKEESVNTSAS